MRLSSYSKIFLPILALLIACTPKEESPQLFRLVDSEASGISFNNDLTMDENMNFLTYMYFYNGGGVSVADFNGDELLDIYFTANQESNKLYLNKGDLNFEDITEKAGVAGLSDAWTTGTTTADVNGDGLTDIYVSMLGNYRGLFASNLLYINQGNDENGIPQFKEQASKYGLDLVGFSTQAAFFDYDLDGDLDMFQLNHSVHSNGTFKAKKLFEGEVHKYAGDKLMRNDDGFFTDVSAEAGIIQHAAGYGLGLGISDLNSDGYPDIYIGNDFHEDDYFYINNQDGTFTESLQEQTRLTSRYSMGNDLADINNDGLVDILSMDMLPKDYEILVKSQTEDPFDIFFMKQRLGYGYQYSRNTLQLNNGNNTFSEIGLYSGIYASDWSWSALVADFNYDQQQDIFISNGIPKRPNDLDYVKFMSDSAASYANLKYGNNADLSLIDKMPELKIPNLLYSGSSDLKFDDVSKEWGLGINSYSSGSAYGDLDNDGDLDLIVNNTYDEAFLFENLTINQKQEVTVRFLKFQLQGSEKNTAAIGSKIILEMKSGEKLLKEVYTTRGFQSSVSSDIHFGIGEEDEIESILIIWPDGNTTPISDYTLNSTIKSSYSASEKNNFQEPTITAPFIKTLASFIDFQHLENKSFNEFAREPLIPHSQSSEGPAFAIGDVDGDGLEDVYIGGAKHQPSGLFLQRPDGFIKSEQAIFRQDSIQEEVRAEFIDFDKDGDLDLAVLTGGNEFYKDNIELEPKLYRNQDGQFEKVEYPFNNLKMTGGAMAWTDYNKDGKLDVFFAARAIPWQYGKPASGYLLEQNQKGGFTINMDIISPFVELGAIKDAVWSDLDNDGYEDLIVAGEWGPVRVFYNDSGTGFTESKDKELINSNGMWNALAIADVNKDGRMDIIAGNLGTNTKLHASTAHPMKMYVKDFDENESSENLIYTYREGEYKLFANKDDITKQLNVLKKKYNSYYTYATASQDEIIPNAWKRNALLREVKELRSCVFINEESGFIKVPLPLEAQFAPINDFLVWDVNGDGKDDLISGGNYYDVHTQIGKYDASYGGIYLNNSDGTFSTLSNHDSGLAIKGEIRHIRKITFQEKNYLLFARNNMSIGFAELKN